MTFQPDVIVIMTDEERAAPPYESSDITQWRAKTLRGRAWFDENALNFNRHYTGSLACVPSRPTIFTGHYPDVHGVTQTDGLGKMADDSRQRWLRVGEVPTLGHWFRASGYDTHYDGKWHMSHADLIDESTGQILATNDAAGVVDQEAVDSYHTANPLDPFGFSGWVGPEPHGGLLANSGFRRDPLIADRVVAWLEDRYSRRATGDPSALRPFLLVASFVNPHDIVLFPAWVQRGMPFEKQVELDPPSIPPSPTDDEDLATKPAAQVAYRASYPTGYGPAAVVARTYMKNAQKYRDLYYRLHAEVDGPTDRVRQAVTDGGSEHAVIVRTSDHGELLGSHGGLHQKWFNLYDEATRVPFSVARIGTNATTGATINSAPTSHIDIVPTLLAVAGIDEEATAEVLRESFTEVHRLPGTNLMPVVDGVEKIDPDRAVYLMTRDNMLEGDSSASAVARATGRASNPPRLLRIQVPPHVGSNFEGLVARVDHSVQGAKGHLWKVVRTFDDPATWTNPGVRHLASSGPAGEVTRTVPLPDQWELYDLSADPNEAINLWKNDSVTDVFEHLRTLLVEERSRAVPQRNNLWPYEQRKPTKGPAMKRLPPPARALRGLVQKMGMHPKDLDAVEFRLTGKSALVVATNTAVLDIGRPTGVFASEMTVPYYAFLDAGMVVDVASPLGGLVPLDPQSLKPVLRTQDDDRFLVDDDFRDQVSHSLAIGQLDMTDYDLVFLSGGWGAAFDFGFSEDLAAKITESNSHGKFIGGVCHGPLGLLNARDSSGKLLVEERRISAVTDKQVRELGIQSTPHHPERELCRAGAIFQCSTRFRDAFANHWVVDGNLVTGQNQNAGPMVAREMMEILAAQ